jgi:hypothetical protein
VVSLPAEGPSDHVLPMPVIVGVPRSGTTLLRLMLDSHSQLAIPPETGFVPGCCWLPGDHGELRENFVQWITTFPDEAPGWRDFGISISSLRDELDSAAVFTVTGGLRTFYRLYAGRFGKPRWGDKTPGYARSMINVESVLPEAHFIHVVRDGRDVALSWRQTWFSPGNAMATLASSWRDWIERARMQSALLEHYLEIRYERLLLEPVIVLREICDFLSLDYEAGMLLYHERSALRLREHRERVANDGRIVVTRRRRLHQQFRTKMPLDISRIGVWKSAMTARERDEFMNEAGDLLTKLGYEI